jgi:hypothetical protein
MEDNLQEGIMRKINNRLLFLVLAFTFFGCATKSNLSQEEGRFIEKSGGFSITIPELWQVAEMPGMKYKLLMGQMENNFTPNINFVDDTFNGSLDVYVDASIEQLKNLLGENFTFIQRNDFVTAKNVKGEKIVTNSFQYERLLQQIFYFFPGKNGVKMVITCTGLAETGGVFDEMFDKTMETFEWTR